MKNLWGICEAASVTPAQLAILNNYTDMRDFSTYGQDEGCTVFAFKNCDEGKSFAGQTWDMHASATPFMVHLTFEKQKHPDLHLLTLTGCFGLSGMNQEGLSIFINNLHCQEAQPGLMWCALVRGMLHQKNTSEAYQYLQNNMPASGHNYLICDPQHYMNIETTGKRHDITHQVKDAQDGHIVHSNHYVGSLKETEMTWRRSKTTEARQAAAEGFFQQNTSDSIHYETLAQELLGVGDFCINVEPKKDQPHASATCGGILVDLNTKSGMVYAGEYADQDIRQLVF